MQVLHPGLIGDAQTWDAWISGTLHACVFNQDIDLPLPHNRRGIRSRTYVEVDRKALDTMADELERHLPRMRCLHENDQDFWKWFAGEAASISANARNKADLQHVCERLNRMLEQIEDNRHQRSAAPH